MPEWFQEREVQLVASMPCYLEENVRAQRGAGVYEKSIEAVKRLNALGYGSDTRLSLSLVYNPGGPFLPPEQPALEADYRRELGERLGITFSRLLTIANMPIGRFRAELRREDREHEYLRLLQHAHRAVSGGAAPGGQGTRISSASPGIIQSDHGGWPDVQTSAQRRLERNIIRLRLQPISRLCRESWRARSHSTLRPVASEGAQDSHRRALFRLHGRLRVLVWGRAHMIDPDKGRWPGGTIWKTAKRVNRTYA
jgi:hypothetical protein